MFRKATTTNSISPFLFFIAGTDTRPAAGDYRRVRSQQAPGDGPAIYGYSFRKKTGSAGAG